MCDLGGDFNLGDINWESNSFKPGGKYPTLCKQLLDIADEFSLHQLVNEPTRKDRILDLFFTSNSSLVNQVMVTPGISDHDGIPLVDMSTKPKLGKQKPRKIFLYNKADTKKLKHDLKNMCERTTSDTNSSKSVEELWLQFRDGINETMENNIPSKMSTNKTRTPWITHSVKRRLRQKQRAYNKAKTSGNENDWDSFRDLRKLVQKESRASYWKYVRTTCLSSAKQFWSFIKKQKTDSSSIPALRSNGQLFSENNKKAEILNQQFQSVFTDEDPLDIPAGHRFPSIPNFSVQPEGVLKILKGLNENKASGPDGISTKILKLAAEEVTPALTLIFNTSLSTGIVPPDWLTANISPVFKKGDKSTASNYRPVSLTSVCCKILEHMLHSNIMRHLDQMNILTDKQHGFRAKHSCETQLIQTIHDLAESLDNKTQVDMVIMDFSKAFDTVPHKRLLHKINNYGITGNAFNWISNFLTKRKQRVVINGEFSEWVHVKSGVPQGMVLGPLLFLLYINDLPDNISSSVKLFADDCVMYNTIKGQSDSLQLQSDLDTLSKWQDMWQMRLNATKCFVLRLSHARSPKQFKYTLGGTTLAETTSHSHLGIEITGDLKWENHIHSITARANRALGFIRRNLYSCPKELKATAYQTLVRPHLEFSSTVWDPYTQELKDQLEKVQRRSARFVCNDYRHTSSVTTMLDSLQWDTLETRRKVARLTMLLKIHHSQTAIPAGKFLQPVTRQSRHHHSKAYQLKSTTKDCYRYSFFPQTTIDWNALPSNIINIPDNTNFKEAVTNHLRSKSTSN